MFRLDTILTLAKSMTTKAVKADGGQDLIVCEIKFSGMPIQREHVDPILGMPFGWAELALFDEQGAPLAHLSITSHRTQLRVTGIVSGPKGDPTLKIMQANLSDQEVGLCNVGGIVAGKLTWTARGDEVEDIAELLGKLCRADLTVSDGEQDDLFAKQRRMTESATSNVLAMLEKMRRTPVPPSEDPQMLVWWLDPETGVNTPGKRCDKPKGCVEVDPPVGDPSERMQQIQGGEASP